MNLFSQKSMYNWWKDWATVVEEKESLYESDLAAEADADIQVFYVRQEKSVPTIVIWYRINDWI